MAKAHPGDMTRVYEIPLPNRRTMRVQASASSPSWFQEALATLSKILALEEGWDSYGAPRIEPGVVESAARFLATLTSIGAPKPSICPTAHGGVQIEWHHSGKDLEIEFLASTKVSVLYEGPEGQEEWEGRIMDSAGKLEKLIGRLGSGR
jgi:hypothetical protein